MNYERWDKKESFTFVEAAMLWCGYNQINLFSRLSPKYVHVHIVLKKLQEDAEKGTLLVEKMPTKEGVWDDAIVAREQLKKWAISKGDKPEFLFPEERVDMDYSKWDQQDSFRLIDAANLWYDIDATQKKVDKTSAQFMQSLVLSGKFKKFAEEGVYFKLPVSRNTATDDWIDAKVSREVLQALAILSGNKPAFLFPEKRSSKNLLPDVIYKSILEDIHNMGRQFERLPSTYAGKEEEALRDHFLTVLEGKFEASATGETFNKKGKTDILLRKDGKNIFIAECKFWKGEKGFLETIYQLLGYLTWRDSKAAVIIFARNKDFSSVLDTIKQIIRKHPNYLNYIDDEDETWFNYLFHLKDDPEREIKMAVMLYHLPKPV
jgi:hypothetical protein